MAESTSVQNNPGRKVNPSLADKMPGTTTQQFESRELTENDSRRSGLSTHQHNPVSMMEDLETHSQVGSGYETDNRPGTSPTDVPNTSYISPRNRYSNLQKPGMPMSTRPTLDGDLSLQQNTEKSAYSMSSATQNDQIWPTISGGLDGLEDTFNGFDDIFQLMDVSYLLNDQISVSQSGLASMNEYSSI